MPVVRLLPLFGALLAASAGALTAPEGLELLDEADRTALERLSVEPAPVRDLALEASLHPDVLVEMELLQARTSAAFQERIEELSRQEQEAVWEIVREPGLLHEIAASDGSRPALERIAEERPARLDGAILAMGSEHADLLAELHGISADAEDRFELLIGDLPPDVRDAYRALVDHPELVTLLASHVRLAVALGDAHRADPRGTRLHLEALGNQMARRDARAAEAWEEAIAEDPDAAAELEEAARAYAEERGVAYEDATSPTIETTVHVSVHPYPYWFGYPAWYAHPYHPWGYWYPPRVHFGFYVHPRHHGFVWFGLPSFHFVYWYEDVWLGHRGHRHHAHHGRVHTYLERHRKHFRHLRHARAHAYRHPRHVRHALRDHPGRHGLRDRDRRHGFSRSLRPHDPLRRGRDIREIRDGRDGPRAHRRGDRRGRDGPRLGRPDRRGERDGDRRRAGRREERGGRDGPRLDDRRGRRSGAERDGPRAGRPERREREGPRVEARREGARRPFGVRAREAGRDRDVRSPVSRERRETRERRGLRHRGDALERRRPERRVRREGGGEARRDVPARAERRGVLGNRAARAERQVRGGRALRGADTSAHRGLKHRPRGGERPRARGAGGRGRGNGARRR